MCGTINFGAETPPLFVRHKYFGLSALAVLILLPLLLAAGLQTAQQWLRFSRDERFDTAQHVTVSVEAATVVWEEEGRELRIGDRFFDVVSSEIRGRELLLRGHFDDTETEVWHLLQHAVQHPAALGYHLLLLLQCFVPISLLIFCFYCRSVLPRWQNQRLAALPHPHLFPPFCPPRSLGIISC